MQYPVVENPRRRRRRKTRRTRRLTAKQLAAGFGGKRSMSGRRSTRRKTYRRRSNPALATLAAVNPRRRYRRRSNPSLRGITGLVNLKMAAAVAGGYIVARSAPTLIQKVWAGVPTTGIGGNLVRVAGTLAVATVAKMATKSNAIAGGIAAGGIGYVLFQLANEYVLPRIGLAGLSDDGLVTTGEIDAITMGGVGAYQVRPDTIGTYIDPVLAA